MNHLDAFKSAALRVAADRPDDVHISLRGRLDVTSMSAVTRAF